MHKSVKMSVAAGTINKASMADRKLLESMAPHASSNICDVKCKASSKKTSKLRKHQVKHKIFLKAEECTIFINLRYTATTPAIGTNSTPAFVRDSSSATSNMGEKKYLKQLRCYKPNSWMLF
ncbi:hypothetical protein ILYODFUR_007522 [Ilyodon furcidens]|uniref:Uncharacterized protein n=1 Tax=Ilyodon furcidens TaxID=33524 RepID=A0ABV0VCQ9_9TELE